MLPNNGSLFYTVKAPTDVNHDHLPSLNTSRRLSARPIMANPSREENGPNTYYQRLTRSYTNPEMTVPHRIAQSYTAKSYDDPGPSMFRQGRLGAPWRHVKQCTGNLGNHICFIDGAVKQKDVTSHPPYGYETSGNAGPKFTYYSCDPRSSLRKPSGQSTNTRNKFNQHARNGFKYWFEEKPAISAFARYSMGTVGNPYGIPGTSLAGYQ